MNDPRKLGHEGTHSMVPKLARMTKNAAEAENHILSPTALSRTVFHTLAKNSNGSSLFFSFEHRYHMMRLVTKICMWSVTKTLSQIPKALPSSRSCDKNSPITNASLKRKQRDCKSCFKYCFVLINNGMILWGLPCTQFGTTSISLSLVCFWLCNWKWNDCSHLTRNTF